METAGMMSPAVMKDLIAGQRSRSELSFEGSERTNGRHQSKSIVNGS